MNRIQELEKKGLIHPPKWMSDNIIFLGITGSTAYGCAMESSSSDHDVVGLCIPRKDLVFPHLAGEIPGFGTQIQRFEQWQEHHVVDPDAHGGKGQKYDLTVHSIVKFFHLAMRNNPNILELLFLPQHCTLHTSQVFQMMRESRHMFLHRGCFAKFKGYAFSQQSKMLSKTCSENADRQADFEKYGFSTKFAYHLVRLLLEVEQILTEGDLDLMRNAELLKSIRRGEWSLERIQAFFNDKEHQLEVIEKECVVIPYSPDEKAIKNLLLQVLEHHYGTLKGAIELVDRDREALQAIRKILDGVNV